MRIEVTKYKVLKLLMAREFHNADGEYDGTELDAYLERVTLSQKELLIRSKKETLTSFVILGDGAFEKQIGGLYIDECLRNEPLLRIRPNASFAMFYKSASEKIELVFYTRFFVISYGSTVKKDKEIRELIRRIEKENKKLSSDPKIRNERLKEYLKILHSGWYPNKMRSLGYLSTVSEKIRKRCYLHNINVNNFPHKKRIKDSDYHFSSRQKK